MELVNGKLKIAVLTGGIGSEREISLQSGRCVSQALISAGFDVVIADIQPDNLDILKDSTIDVFFPALHGEFGEDGQLQQVLKDKSLVYTGSGPTASRLAFDKMAGKKFFKKAGAATPEAVVFDENSDFRLIESRLKHFKDGYVIKPISQGSSVGVTIVKDSQQIISTAKQTLDEFGDCMIEQFIPGREITVGILKESTLPIIEIRSKTGFYDYQAKYIDEHTEYLFDTIKDTSLIAQIEQNATDCFCALGCRHFARVDFILSEQAIPYVLEVNTIPGFTTHSLLPKAAAKAGLTMSDLCSKIVEAAHSSLIRH
ncbi:MAG: D-alanine--D-alanine ligase [Sedimentisphaerales bacterium]|nr:D-alanine--D-alanine ligase [Sedimentisphaerales bacterium]